MKKIGIAVFSLMFIAVSYVSAQSVEVDFDRGSDVVQVIKISKESKITQSVKPQLPLSVIEKSTPPKIQTLSDLIGKCSQKNQINFYKSLFFVGGKLASMNVESVKEDLTSNEIAALMNMLGEKKSKGEQCFCIFRRLQCSSLSFHSCDTGTCNGTCTPNLPSKSNLKYTDMAIIFTELPQEIAQEFAGSFILDNGKLEGYYYGGISKHLDSDKTKEILKTLMNN